MVKLLRLLASVSLLVTASLGLAACRPPVGSWSSRASATIARAEVSYTYSPLTHRFYLAGGSLTAQESYNPATDTWSRVAPLPTALNHIQSVELNGLIYYIGGLVTFPSPAVGTVYIYDPVANSFTTGTPMPAGRARGAGGVAVHDGKIYYAGGLANGIAVAWFDQYDPATRTWTALPNMPTARDHFHAAVVGDRFFAIGGRNRFIGATTGANQAFDFTTHSWTTNLAPLPTQRGGFAAAVLGSQILIIGGERTTGTLATVEAYNTSNNTWSTLAPMHTARHGIEAAVCNGNVYIVDGGLQPGGGTPTAVHESYSQSDDKSCTPST